MAQVLPWHFSPILIVGLWATLRIPLQVPTVDALAQIDEAWVHALAISGEALDEASHQPGQGCGNRASRCIRLRLRFGRPALAFGFLVVQPSAIGRARIY